MSRMNEPSGEQDPRLYYGQVPLRVDSEGCGVVLVPFARVDQELADTLTVAARTVPSCVARDFGQDRLSGYQARGSKTLKRVNANSTNSDLEAYVIAVAEPYGRMSDLFYGIGVATISLAEIVPADGHENANLRNLFNDDCRGVVGTFWFGSHPEKIGRSEDVSVDVGRLVSGLLVPRMVQIADAIDTFACTFVASEASRAPDQTSAMREHMTKVASGKWLSPVDNPAVEYDLLVA